MSVKWLLNGKGRVQTYTVINYDNEQGPGSKCFFQTLTGKRLYFCVILAMGSYNDCMLELKKYENLTLHFPLVADKDYLLSREIIEGLNEQKYNWKNSCRSEAINVNLIAEMDKESEIEKTIQQKRVRPYKQLMLCSNKRPNIE